MTAGSQEGILALSVLTRNVWKTFQPKEREEEIVCPFLCISMILYSPVCIYIISVRRMGQYISFIHSFLRLFPDYLSKRMGRYLLHPFLYTYTSASPGASGAHLNPIPMARFIITTKHVKNTNGIRIEPGMSVQVVTQSMSNPVTTNGGQVVIDAFMRIYGIDIKKAGCLNMVELEVEQY